LHPGKQWEGVDSNTTAVAVDASGQRIARADTGGHVIVGRFAEGVESVSFRGAGRLAHGLRFSPDGQWLAAEYHGAGDFRLRVDDVSREEETLRVERVQEPAWDFSADSRRLDQIAAVTAVILAEPIRYSRCAPRRS
jgi:hypothetical protein